jgi:hypothetical protein
MTIESWQNSRTCHARKINSKSSVMRIPVKWATDSGDVGQGRSEATLVVFLQ